MGTHRGANGESPRGGAERRHSPQTYGYVEENATRRSGHTNPDAVNNRGLGFRGGKVWLPKSNIKTSCERRKSCKLLIRKMRDAV